MRDSSRTPNRFTSGTSNVGRVYEGNQRSPRRKEMTTIVLASIATILLASSIGAAGETPAARRSEVAFAKILVDGPPAGAPRPDGIECYKPGGSRSSDDLCIDWRTSMRFSFDKIRAITLERQEMPRELENLKRWMEDLPELPSTDKKTSYLTVLTIDLPEESWKAYVAFAKRHTGELFDIRIGGEHIDGIVLREPRGTATIRIRFASDLTDRLRALFAPIRNRLTVR